MLEIAQIVGSLSAVLLILAGGAALIRSGRVQLPNLDGGISVLPVNTGTTLWLLTGALLLSALAAVLGLWHAGGF